MKNAIKVISFVLAVILVGTAACLVYFKWGKGEFKYIDGEKSGTVIITEYIGDAKDVVIPNRIRGKKVTGIDEGAFMETEITSVKFNDNITSISKSAFNGCNNLVSVETGKSVISIGDYAFANCESLKSVTLNKAVEKIGVSVFTNDSALENVSLEGNENFVIEDGVLYSADKTKLYEVLPYAGLTQFEMPSTVSKMNANAFANCTELKEITLSPSLTVIPSFCFLSCTSLNEIVIPDGVQKIEPGFIANSGVKRVVIPKSVTNIDESAFKGLTTSVTIATPEFSNAEYFAKENNINVEAIK